MPVARIMRKHGISQATPAASAIPQAFARDGDFHFRTVYFTGKLTDK